MDPWKYNSAHDLGLTEAQRWKSLQRESGLLAFLGRHLWWWWVRGVLRILERVEVTGLENMPHDPPFILVCNHASHLDAVVIATALPLRLRSKVFPIAAGDTFFETAAMSAFAAGAMNALPMWRHNCGRHALDQLRTRLVNEPCGYILFPEGTRTRTGQMAPFRHGVGMLIASAPAPVIPCRLSGTFEAMGPGKHWPRRARIALRIGAPLHFENVANDRQGWQSIAQTLQAAITALDSRGPEKSA